MSEFKIIKCKSCGAALVELRGERLGSCIQCGYDFTHKVNKKAKLESIVEQAFEKKFAKKSEISNQILIENDDEYDGFNQQSSQKTSQSSLPNQSKSSKPQLQPKPKNPVSIIGTIIKWYIILFIASKVLGVFF